MVNPLNGVCAILGIVPSFHCLHVEWQCGSEGNKLFGKSTPQVGRLQGTVRRHAHDDCNL